MTVDTVDIDGLVDEFSEDPVFAYWHGVCKSALEQMDQEQINALFGHVFVSADDWLRAVEARANEHDKGPLQ